MSRIILAADSKVFYRGWSAEYGIQVERFAPFVHEKSVRWLTWNSLRVSSTLGHESFFLNPLFCYAESISWRGFCFWSNENELFVASYLESDFDSSAEIIKLICRFKIQIFQECLILRLIVKNAPMYDFYLTFTDSHIKVKERRDTKIEEYYTMVDKTKFKIPTCVYER